MIAAPGVLLRRRLNPPEVVPARFVARTMYGPLRGIGVLVIVFGTGMALVPNAALVTAQVPKAVAVAAIEEQGMQPAGARK